MNKFRNIFPGIMIIAAMMFIQSCVKGDFDTPDINIPKVDFDANTTLPELIAMHTAGGLEAIDSNIIVKGVIVANDESGNFYKQLIIEGESAGLQIQIDETDLFKTYKLGQRIFVKCQGLSLGEYGGNLQLGYSSGGEIGRIPSSMIEDHIFLDSLPGAQIAPISLTIPTITSGYFNMLVKFENLQFTDAGQLFSNAASSTNHDMVDPYGNIIILRTSNYATFAADTLPAGTGTVTGVLSIFGSDYQMYIRDLNDLSGFDE